MRNREEKRQFGFLILSFIALATFLRFFMIANQSLWVDEGLSLIRTDGESFSIFLDQLISELYDKYQPAYFISLFFWRQLFGDSVTALRSLSVIFSIPSIIFTTLVSLKIYGRRHALWTTALVSFSAFHIYYSQEVRAYSLVMLLASLELYLFSDVLVNERKVSFKVKLLFWLTVISGCLSSVFIFILTLSICLSHFCVRGSLRGWLNWWLPLAACVLPALLFYSTSPSVADLKFSLITWQGGHLFKDNIPFVAYGLIAGTTYLLPPHQLRVANKARLLLDYWPHLLLLLYSLASILLSLGKILFVKFDINKSVMYRGNVFFTVLIAISFFLSTVFAMATHIHWIPRHSSFMFLIIPLLIPSTFCQLSEQSSGGRLLARAARLGAMLLIAINIYSLNNYFFDPSYAREDHRSVAEYIVDQDGSSVKSFSVGGSVRLLRFYGDMKTTGITSNVPEFSPEIIQARVDGADKVFLAVYRNSPLYSVAEAALRSSYTLESKKDFQHLAVYKYVRN